MTALIIIGIILLLISVLLFFPVSVLLKFKEEFDLKIKFAALTVYSHKKAQIKGQNVKNKDTENVDAEKSKTVNRAKTFFSKLEKQKGFAGAVKETMGFAQRLFTHIKRFLKHLRIRSVKLDITVASEDAAKTAIEYGIICNAVYPVVTLLETNCKIAFKSINVQTDFNKENPNFSFSATVRVRIFYLLILTFKVFSEYKKFITEIDKNE